MKSVRTAVCLVLVGIVLWVGTSAAEVKRGHLETTDLPPYLRDRGEGLPTSMFGTFIQEKMWIFYPFVEGYWDHDIEYSPSDFGNFPEQELRGEFEAYEALIFLGYAPTDWLAFEVEAAYMDAKLTKAGDDTSGLPQEIEDSGLGDVEGQIRWRYNKESASTPEFFSYFETVFPTADEGSLIGTTDWEFKLGVGLIRGWSFGTMTFRVAAEYGLDEETFELGEAAVEYLRRIDDKWRINVAVEGTQDEWEFIPQVQHHFNRSIFLNANVGFALTSKATDIAPELGVAFSF